MTSGRELPPTRRGYQPHEAISALQKALRRSDGAAAVYWAAELGRSGYEHWLWARLRVIASEDVGPGAPGIATEVRTLHDLWRNDQRRGDGALYLIHAVLLLATAPKSRVVDWALFAHWSDHMERRDVPDEALDKHTRRGRRMGRGTDHFVDGGPSTLVQPDPAMLDRLETEYREHFRRVTANDPDLPKNPWRETETKPAHNSRRALSGQLRLGPEEDR